MIFITVKPVKISMLFLLVIIFLSGCVTVDKNYNSRQTHYVDPGKRSAAPGIGDIGIDSYDIIEMTDKMTHEILSDPKLPILSSRPESSLTQNISKMKVLPGLTRI